MAKLAQFPDLTGAIDGINRDYFVPPALLPVDPDSERVFVRGIPRVKAWDDGWEVIDYPTGHVRLNEALYDGDAPPALLFLQDVGDLPVTEVTPISGCVRKSEPVSGAIDATRTVKACLTAITPICSDVRRLSVRGTVTIERRLTGKVEEC